MSFDQNDPLAAPHEPAGGSQPGSQPPVGTPGQPAAYPGQPPVPGATPPPAGGFPPPAAAPQYAAPATPAYQAPNQAYTPVGTNPGKTMGVVGFILSILVCIPFAPLAGLIVSIVAMVKSRKAGYGNGLALAGIIIGAVVILAQIIVWFAIFAAVVSGCSDLGPGVHEVNGITLTCS